MDRCALAPPGRRLATALFSALRLRRPLFLNFTLSTCKGERAG